MVFLYLGILSRKLWGVRNFHRLWPVGLPPDRILPGVFHGTWGPHPHLAGTLNTIHSNHFAGWPGKRFGEIKGTFQPLKGSDAEGTLSGCAWAAQGAEIGVSLRNTRLPPPASSTTLFAASLIVPGTAHVTGCEEEKKMQSHPCYSSDRKSVV